MVQMSQALLSPYYALGLFTHAKSFEDNPILGSRWLNDRGLHRFRVALADRVAAMRRRQLAHLLSVADRRAFARDGFVLRENFLPADAFAALIAQAKTYRGRVSEFAQGSTVNRKLAVDRRTLGGIPALRALLGSPEWRGLIAYIGSRDTEPAVFIQTLIRNAAPETGEDPQTLLHADTFHPTAKAWFFLADVEADAGPFAYVPGSHHLTPQRLAWEHEMSIRASHAEIAETREGSFRVAASDLGRLDLPQPRLFAVPANTLVVADTFGFHARGASPRPSRRVEVFAIGSRSPFTPWRGTGWASPLRKLENGRLRDLIARRDGAGQRRASAFDW
jgi:hypothetical protein